MYDEDELDRLIAAMRATGTTRLSVKSHGKRLRLVLPEGAVLPPPAPRNPQSPVTSPAIGCFHPRGGEDGLHALEPGAEVSAGEVLGYLAQGAALAVVTAPESGRLMGEIPAPGRVCGYGDILFTIEAKT